MRTAEEQFDLICASYAGKPGVEKGKMMSSPGLKYNNKVFAFLYKEKMGLRLGPSFDPDKWGLKNPEPLSPFKVKPPLKGWLLIDQREMDLWEPFADMALTFTQTLK
ncbi:MAG: hypothetical protein RIA62_18345 [Cyclobacteriaceae bacterium]